MHHLLTVMIELIAMVHLVVLPLVVIIYSTDTFGDLAELVIAQFCIIIYVTLPPWMTIMIWLHFSINLLRTP